MRYKNHILWGQKNAHGPLWLKLADYQSKKQCQLRRNEGWKLICLPIGQCPEFDNAGNLITPLMP